MLIEALQHFLIPAPKHIKEMGYLKESIAIEERYKRCQIHWQPHLDNCKNEILKASQNLNDGEHIMILGSGALHDVPIDELVSRGLEITLVDIVHLPKIRKKFVNTPNVNFIEQDITGMIKSIYNAVKLQKPIKPAKEWALNKKPDLIVSLNILSQLAIKLVQFCKDNKVDIKNNFHDNILKDHIKWLKKQDTKILLISDLSREYLQGQNLLENIPAIPDRQFLSLNKPDRNWKWDIAPTGEADKEISIIHNVGAWSF